MRNHGHAWRVLAASALSAAALLAGCGGDGDDSQKPAAVDAKEACNAFSGKSIAGAAVDSAELVAATAASGEYCRVKGSIHTNLAFQIDLPSTWNGMLLAHGGGGWDGDIQNYGWSPSTANGQYVAVRTNGGRAGSAFDASPYLNNPQAQTDFGYLSMHTAYEVALEMISSRYGKAPTHKYFEGCSNGGREALVQATRFPDDYDGIIARAPAYNFSAMLQHYAANTRAMAVPGGYLSDTKGAAITQAALAKCDADDGLADGIISKPQACGFEVESLRCTGGETDNCLTDAQLVTAKTLYSPLVRADGSEIYPGWGFGGEATDWAVWLTGSAIGGVGSQTIFADGMVKYWITQDPSANLLTFDPQAHRPALGLAAALIDAGTQLGPFFQKGGKLLLVHGTTDWAISYKASIKYFDDVGTAVTPALRDSSMEFYLQPGVGHCMGGTGLDAVDLIKPLRQWVEAGLKPSAQPFVAEKLGANGQPTMSRPMCKYPSYARYMGAGDVAAAQSYECTQ